MPIRKIPFTFMMAELEAAALDNLQIASGGRDRASVLRALIWRASRDAGILTDGDLRELSKQEKRGRKPLTQRSVIYDGRS